ncbi:MAG TPA: glycosyltransferase family 2 protein, partial [Ignavibacteria bacterium]|nr:glycosyltransferase family 2 protein [Ignavibacteria bacterium]
MNKKIAIIIPTIHRDELLIRTLRSIFKVREPSWQILVIDQNKQEDDSEEKLYYYQQPPNHLTVIRTDY